MWDYIVPVAEPIYMAYSMRDEPYFYAHTGIYTGCVAFLPPMDNSIFEVME